MSKTYQYRPQGVCSQLMEITVNDGILEAAASSQHLQILQDLSLIHISEPTRRG